VICLVTDEGRALLDALDPQVNTMDEEVVAALSETQLARFVELLDLVRAANAERGAPRTTAAVRRAEPFGALRAGDAKDRRRPDRGVSRPG